MSKRSARVMMCVMVIAGLAALSTVSSCAVPDESVKTGGVLQFFPSAIGLAEISQGVRVSGRSGDAIVSEIRGDMGVLGYRVESKVVSRSGPFRIRVILDKQLYVKQATVISYPWKRGRDVCKRVFTDQFTGKGPGDAIRLGRDIDAMTGATISSRVMTRGVRDAIELVRNLASGRFPL